MIIEVVRFRTKPGVTDEALLAASKVGTQEFFAKQPGYAGRELARSQEDEWVDVVHWTSIEDAEADERAFFSNRVTQQLMAMIDLTSVKVERWKVVTRA